MNLKIIYTLIAIWLIIEIFIGRWMFKAKPDKSLLVKYPRKIIFLSQLPFGRRWKKFVAPDDLKAMEKYQYRITISYLTIIIPWCLSYIYFYMFFRALSLQILSK